MHVCVSVCVCMCVHLRVCVVCVCVCVYACQRVPPTGKEFWSKLRKVVRLGNTVDFFALATHQSIINQQNVTRLPTYLPISLHARAIIGYRYRNYVRTPCGRTELCVRSTYVRQYDPD